MSNFDTYISKILSYLTTSLSYENYQRLDKLPNQWDDIYITFLLNVYCQMCNSVKLMISFTDDQLLEPIILYINTDKTVKNIPDITHVISLYSLKQIFGSISLISTNACEINSLTFVPPKIFTKTTCSDTVNESFGNLSSELTNNLLRLICIADHAAYHYNSFAKLSDCDYKHINIIKRHAKSPKHVEYFHDLLTKKPNRNLMQFTEPHDILNREDKEITGGYSNEFHKMFIYNTNENVNQDESESSSSSDDE